MQMASGSNVPNLYKYGPGVTASYEQEFITHLDNALSDERINPKFTAPNGEPFNLSESFLDLLREIVHALANGQVVTIVAGDRELTTQEAADILNVSRPFLVKLLDEGRIPYVKTGSHRRVRFSDLMDFKANRDAQRRVALDRLTQMSQDMGLDT